MGFSCAESRFRPSLSSQTKRGRGEAEARSERPRPLRRHIHLMLPKNLGILRGHGSFSPVERETTNEERTKGKRDEMRRDTREGTMKTKARRERERAKRSFDETEGGKYPARARSFCATTISAAVLRAESASPLCSLCRRGEILFFNYDNIRFPLFSGFIIPSLSCPKPPPRPHRCCLRRRAATTR